MPPLDQIRERVQNDVRLDRQKVLAQHRADSLAAALKGTPSLTTAATARGLQVQQFGPFTRLHPPSYLGREPTVVGTAFGLGVGERSGVIKGEGGYFIIESLGRKLADSSAWLAQRNTQRDQLRQAVQQSRMQQYMEGLARQGQDRRPAQGSVQVTSRDGRRGPLDLLDQTLRFRVARRLL